MINYDTQKAALETQLRTLETAQETQKAKDDERDGKLTLSFHPSDSLIEIAGKLNTLVGELGYGVDSVAVTDRTLPARSNPDAEQARADRTVFAPASQLEKERVRVATGQSAGPATTPGEAAGGVVGVRDAYGNTVEPARTVTTESTTVRDDRPTANL